MSVWSWFRVLGAVVTRSSDAFPGRMVNALEVTVWLLETSLKVMRYPLVAGAWNARPVNVTTPFAAATAGVALPTGVPAPSSN